MLDDLNEQQKNTVLGSFTQDTLVLAGAGAGKSKTLIERIKYIIENRNAKPDSVMAITFTNKAAKELLDRIKKINNDADEMWVGTFHSICIRLLRMFGDEIGLSDFTILDPYNAKKAATEILVKMGAITSKTTLNNYLGRVSFLKNELITAKKYRDNKLAKYVSEYEASIDPEYEFINFYSSFQRENLKNQTIDFDDIILYTIFLLRKSANAQKFIKDTFKYIHVDETQDSNTANIVLFKLLSKDCNLFVVADIDQSIYGWRGAKPEYLVKNSSNFKLFKLEQNYRSTQTIVNASNNVISHNVNRIDKTCFSKNRVGDAISIKDFSRDYDEATFVAKEILAYKRLGVSLNNVYILYRTNAQSRIFEETFIKYGVPYNIIGAVGFNDRQEIKDALAFIRVAVNHKDKQSFKRAMLTLEGVGKTAVEDIMYLYDVKRDAVDALTAYYPKSKKSGDSVKFMLDLLNLATTRPYDIVEKAAYYFINKYALENTPKSLDRVQNLEELIKVSKEKEKAGLDIKMFIDQMDLLSSKDKSDTAGLVSMMTVHASKGLESSIVFGVGMNEGILPHDNSIGDPNKVEEERRLMYVLMTRPKDKLYLTSFGTNGQKTYHRSRFISEIPTQFTEKL